MQLDYMEDEIEMPKESETTSKRLMWFVLSIVVMILLAVIGGWANTQASSIDDHTKRIEGVERTEAVHTSQFEDVKGRLDKIDKKIDHVIDNQEEMKRK